MITIGLTGGIASGKTTVSGMLVQKGAHLIDADLLAREVVEPGQPAWHEIVDWLGDSILLPDQKIDRTKLAELVFSDSVKLDRLNSIIHPKVGSLLIQRSKEIKEREPEAIIVYDIPLLVEAGMQKMVDMVLLVYVTRNIQLDRLQNRDGLCREDAELRLQAQMPLEKKKKYAHFVIDNSGTFQETARQVEEFWNRMIESKH
ncbi:MAG: dephospho-CoA kinase [Bacillota bacterium]|nr:dephospho-CoA kinase [Bacillota bacterium]